jgi:hypothetical protein
MQEKVSIRPGVAILGILKHIEYDPWYAFAEFVDNSIDSYLKNEKKIRELEGDDFQLVVSIEINATDGLIRIVDNAGGIDEGNYGRAFRPAERPPDNSGLSEFGMGMKSASCWFSDYWSVRTTALNEPFEKTVIFDMDKIFYDNIEELEIISKPASPNVHYTILELRKVHRMPHKKTLLKIQSHLTSIYRDFLRKEILILKFNGQPLVYEEPKILNAPPYNDPTGESIIWRKNISFPVEENLSVHGFVAIREKASLAEAGLALFRRGRVIQGSFDQTFRPHNIFGNPNSYSYQRIFGELHLEGFSVSFSKRGFQADENMDIFLDLLRSDIKEIIKQADEYRVRASESDYKKTASVLKNTVSAIEKVAQEVLPAIRNLPYLTNENTIPLTQTEKSIHQSFVVDFNDAIWEIIIEMSFDSKITEFYEVGEHLVPKTKDESKNIRKVGIRLSLTHSFMVQFAGVDKSRIEPTLKIVAALGLAETIARSAKATNQGEIRRNLNELISKLIMQKVNI